MGEERWILTDENISSTMVKALRSAGCNVKDIKEEGLQGISDDQVVTMAQREKRVILTHDKDFSNVLHGRPVAAPVILLRFSNQSPGYVKERFLPLYEKYLAGKKFALVVVTDEYVRIVE